MDRPSRAHRAPQRYVVNLGAGVERRPDGARPQLRRGEVEIVDLLGRMVRPFISQRKAQSSWPARRVDHVAAHDLRLFAAIEREGRNLQCSAMSAQNPAVTFVKPLRRSAPHSGGRTASFDPHLEHASRVGLRGRGLCVCCNRRRGTVHRVPRLHAACVRQARACHQDAVWIGMVQRRMKKRCFAVRLAAQ